VKTLITAILLFTNAVLSGKAQLDAGCTVTLLNRSAQVRPDGSFAIPNLPVEPGLFRLRITCAEGGVTTGGQSSFVTLQPNGITVFSNFTFGPLLPLPVQIQITSPKTTFTTQRETAQLTATAMLPDGSPSDVTQESLGTFWSSSNPNVASVNSNGVVTALRRGQAIIQARNEGVLASLAVTVLIPNDADSDGMTDEYERANGLNPNDASDAAQDADGDGLTNLEEFQRGTNPRNADTDGDTLTDSSEIARGTNPLLADTDGDGLSDGQELLRGSNPLSRDTDSDGIADGLEVQLGLSLTNANPVTTVQGRVVDTSGVPVTNAAVTVFSILTANSDASGFFTLNGVPAGLGAITVLAEVVRTGQVLDGMSAPINPVSGGVSAVGTIQIGLNAGTVAGLVTNPAGAAVPGALVTVTSGTDTRTATADGNGRYRVSNMTAGDLVVTARDYRTGLRGRSTATLAVNTASAISVQLGSFGTVVGTVLNKDNMTPVGAGVTVTYSGPTARTTTTDALGRYTFDFVPLGSFAVETSDATGNRGRSTGNISTTGRTVVTDITYLGQGNVTGLVFAGTGVPATNATVELRSRSVFGGGATAFTGSGSQFAFSNVFVGDFDVTAFVAATRLAGYGSSRIDRDGQTVILNVTVAASGSFTGMVFRADGVTPVPNARVTLSPTSLSATTDAEGRFRFDFLPLGNYAFDVTDPATGDRGRAASSLVQQDQVQGVNITLLGFGNLIVTVRDGNGDAVQGAQVTVSSQAGFAFSRSTTTSADGTTRFDQFLAGGFSVSAFDPTTQLGGSASGSVVAGGTASVTVNLQQAGSIAGLVLSQDGSNAVANIRLALSGPVSRQTYSAGSGSFTFPNLPLGSYAIEAFDGAENRRGRLADLTVVSQGQQLLTNVTLSGVGGVTGVVILATGPPVPNVPLTLRSSAPGSRGSFLARTDVNGRYAIDLVPVGGFAVEVNTRSGNDLFVGSTNGTLTTDGETVAANVVVNSFFDPQPTVRFDANNMTYDVAGNGAIEGGTRTIFQGAGGVFRGFGLLDIITGGTTNRFAGEQFGAIEEAGKEIVISQSDLVGLNVTRKVYVPRDGYFARCLDLISNPSAAPVTFNARVTSFYRFIAKVQGGFQFQREPRVLSTSSGDATLGTTPTTDQWLIVDDDDDGDPFLINTLPATADVFDGPGATLSAGALDYMIDFGARFGRSVQEWQGITLQPGETVALLRFVSEQTSRGAARASAERLIQLPPEALIGLSATELSQIRNFNVPAGGVGSLAPLPPLVGTVRGRALAADGVLPVPNATVRLRSASAYLGRAYSRTTDGNGSFSFVGALNDSGSSVAIPVEGFALVATDSPTGYSSPEVSGGFGPGLLVADQDVVFSNSGILLGTVTRAGGVVTVGNVALSGGALLNVLASGLGGDGSYLFRVVPSATYTATATLPIPQGTPLSAAVSATLNAGTTTRADIVLPQTGGVGGTLFTGAGDVAVDSVVYLQRNQFQRATRTGTGGEFSFLDVPIGSFVLSSFEPFTGIASSSNVVVVTDQTTSQNLRWIGLGTVRVQAMLTGGGSAANAPVHLSEAARGSGFRSVGNIGASGQLVLARVPLGNFTARVFNPGNTALFTDVTGSVQTNGQTIDVLAVVPVDAPPTVTLTAPQDGQSLLEGASISLSATASDDLGIRRVEFLVEGQVVGSDSFAPYSIGFQLPQVTSNRSLAISAVAFDSGTNRTASGAISITDLDDVIAPTVSFVTPTNGATFREGVNISLQASATDNVRVERVEFSANGVPFGVDTASPYTWVFRVPDEYTTNGTRSLTFTATAFDPSSQSNAATVTVNIISDEPPSITLTSPTNGQQVVEGSTLMLQAAASDDVGVTKVEFFANGVFLGLRLAPPFTNIFRLSGGSPGPVAVQAVATDTLGQTGTNIVTIIRLDDTNAPTVAITAPRDGSIVTVGDSDVAVIIDISGSTGSDSGADVDGDGIPDNILKAEIFSALQLLNFFNPTNTRVAIVAFDSGASLRQILTNNYFAVRQALTNILNAGPQGGTDFNNAMRVGTDELVGVRARRNATAVQLFLSDGSASFPANEVTRAAKGGICVNTFAVGAGASPDILRQMATNSGCVFTPVVNVGDLVRILPQIILFGINQLAIVADADDNVAVREVDFAVNTVGGGQQVLTDSSPPFQVLFGLPMLTNSVNLSLTATARDFGDNQATSAPVGVTFLPAENSPQITMLMPPAARIGTNVTILGKFLNPVATNNIVTFNGVRATVLSGNKISLSVRVPDGAMDGAVMVEADGLRSGGAPFQVLPTGMVALQVNFADGMVATDARVEIYETNVTTAFRLAGFTDALGRLSITNVTGNFVVRAFHPQNAALSSDVANNIPGPGQTAPITVTLPSAGAVLGTVRFADGSPAANSQVRLIVTNFITRTYITGTNGGYRFDGVPVERALTVRAVNPQNASVFVDGTGSLASQSEIATVDLTLPGLGTLVVQVNLGNGALATNAPVSLRESTTNTFRFIGRTGVDGRVAVSNVALGPFTVRGLNPINTNLFAEAANSLAADGETKLVTVALSGTGTVLGRVTFADGITGVSNVIVQWFGPNLPTQTVRSGSNGLYMISQIPTSRVFTVRALHPTNNSYFKEVANNFFLADAEALMRDMALPALATLRVTVLRTDGTPFVGARVNLRHAFTTSFQFVGTANSNGVINAANVPEGSFTMEARDPSTFAFSGNVSGFVRAADNGLIVSVTIIAPAVGTVQGTIFAGDSATPVPFARLEIRDAASGNLLDSRNADVAGKYGVTGLIAGNAGFRVIAFAPFNLAISNQATGVFTNTGQTLTLDLMLPLSIVRGTVYEVDGSTPVEYPTVSVEQTDTNGMTIAYPSSIEDFDGTYLLLGVGLGPFVVRASDPESGLLGSANGAINNLASPVEVDVVLPASGSIVGLVLDAALAPVPFAQLALASPGLAGDALFQADSNGGFVLDRVPLGQFYLQACDDNVNCGVSTGVVNVASQVVSNNILLRGTSTVTGTVRNANGAVVPDAFVTIQNAGVVGPLGYYFGSVRADTNGFFLATNVPSGIARVFARPAAVGLDAGFAMNLINPDQTAMVDVTVGNAVQLPYNLDGGDGFRYDVRRVGNLADGGTTDRRLRDAFDGAAYLSVNDDYFWEFDEAILAQNSRELVFSPAMFSTLTVTRRVYVPASGGFVRYVETLSNAASFDRNVRVRIDSSLGSDDDTRVVVSPTSNGNTFAVTDDGPTGTDPALSHVFVGSNAPVAASALQFADDNGEIFYEWNVTVPAGQTVALMHFIAQREPGDTPGAEALARSIVSGTASNMLDGLTQTDVSQIVNFDLSTAVQPSLVQSQAAVLLRIEPLEDGASLFRWAAAGAQNCVVETSTDLQRWETLSTNAVSDGTFVLRVPVSEGEPQRFYQLHFSR